MENNFTDKLINSYAGSICGIDVEKGTFSPDILIVNANNAGGTLRIYNEDVDAFDSVMAKIARVDDNGFDDGYSKDIDVNAIIKLNGIGFENFLDYYSNGRMKRKSKAVFSTEKKYEDGTDFILTSYTIKKDNAIVPEKPLEAKNCLNMNTFLKTRVHNTLYVIVNSREEGIIRLLCKLTPADRLDLSGLEVFGDFKVIPYWFWMSDILEHYSWARLDYSWEINRGGDEFGKYIEFVSPRNSNKKTVE